MRFFFLSALNSSELIKLSSHIIVLKEFVPVSVCCHHCLRLKWLR